MFPWDYRTGELGPGKVNPTTAFIDLCARYGQAYELKSVSAGMVARRAARSGDGTHATGPGVWGYGDHDIPDQDKEELQKME